MPLDPISMSIVGNVLTSVVVGCGKEAWSRTSSWVARNELEKQIDTATTQYCQYFNEERNALVLPSSMRAPLGLNEVYIDQYVGDSKELGVKHLAVGHLASKRLCVITGRPGAGKSVLLTNVAIEMLKRCPESKTTPSIPIVLDCKLFDTSESSLRTLIADRLCLPSEINSSLVVDGLLNSGGVSMFWDGLDEIASRPELLRVIDQIQKSSWRYPNCKQYVSCRTGYYQNWFPKFHQCEVLPFTLGQANELITKWFAYEQKKAASLIKSLELSEVAREIANSPLLLSLACVAAEDDLKPFNSRTDLLETSITTLLSRLDARKLVTRHDVYKGLSTGDRSKLLQYIAYSGAQRGKREWKEQEIAEIAADRVANTMRKEVGSEDGLAIISSVHSHHGILERMNTGTWVFSHASIEDYLAAKHLKGISGDKELIACAIDSLKTDNMRGVIINAVCLMSDATDVIETLLQELENMIEDSSLPHLKEKVKQLVVKSSTWTPTVSRTYALRLVYSQILHMMAYVDSWVDLADDENGQAKLRDAIPHWLLSATEFYSSDATLDIRRKSGIEMIRQVRSYTDDFEAVMKSIVAELEMNRSLSYSPEDANVARLFDLSRKECANDLATAVFGRWKVFREFGAEVVRLVRPINFIYELASANPSVSNKTIRRCFEEPSQLLAAALV